MSYSFTDDSTNDPLSTTMMVPFVDLLNHHDDHNAELSYHKKYLRLVAIKDIEKVLFLIAYYNYAVILFLLFCFH